MTYMVIIYGNKDLCQSFAPEIAAEYPFASHNAVEVWPVMHRAGREM
jgi:hypothetical protein